MFTSDRENQSNLFRHDLDPGLVMQITDRHGTGRPVNCVSAANKALYSGWQGQIIELSMAMLEERVLREEAVPMLIRDRANPTAAAHTPQWRHVCVMLTENRSEEKPAIVSHSSGLARLGGRIVPRRIPPPFTHGFTQEA